MMDEFDDITDPRPLASTGAGHLHGARPGVSPARLVSRMYLAADAPLRVRLLACLLRPLGLLSLAAVAAGAFAGFIDRIGASGLTVSLEDAGRYSGEQIVELARFIEQISPESLRQFALLVSDSAPGAAAVSVAAAIVLMRTLMPSAPRGGSTRVAGPDPK